jgi:hypothetical protein
MDKAIIENHSELIQRIAVLKWYKVEMEGQLKDSFSVVASTLNLASFFEAGTKKAQPIELVKSGANMVLDIIAGLIMRKHRGIKGYLSAVIMEKVTSVLIDKYLINIMTGVNTLFRHKS